MKSESIIIIATIPNIIQSAGERNKPHKVTIEPDYIDRFAFVGQRIVPNKDQMYF